MPYSEVRAKLATNLDFQNMLAVDNITAHQPAANASETPCRA